MYLKAGIVNLAVLAFSQFTQVIRAVIKPTLAQWIVGGVLLGKGSVVRAGTGCSCASFFMGFSCYNT